MSAAKLLLYIQDDQLRTQTISILQESAPHLLYSEHQSDWNALLDRIGQSNPEVLLLDLSAVPGELAIGIRQLRHYARRLKVVVLHAQADADTILRSMRAGANEFLHPPMHDTLVPALERMFSSDESSISTSRGKIIGFLSAKGGCGATTLACHVSSELQRLTQKSVLLADLDLNSGLVGFLMKTPSAYSVLDPLRNLSRLDESLWKALLVEHKPNLAVIPAPAAYSRWDHPDEAQLRQLLQFMRTQHDWIVLDLGSSLNSIATAVLDEVDQLFLVSTLEVVALHGLKSIVHGLIERGEKLQVVLNRTPKMMDISSQELEKILGRSLYACLPNDYMSLYQSYSSGNLLDPHNKLAQHFGLLASKIAGITPGKSKKRFALFG